MDQKWTRNGPEMGPKSDPKTDPFREQKVRNPFEFLVFLQLSPPESGPETVPKVDQKQCQNWFHFVPKSGPKWSKIINFIAFLGLKIHLISKSWKNFYKDFYKEF